MKKIWFMVVGGIAACALLVVGIIMIGKTDSSEKTVTEQIVTKNTEEAKDGINVEFSDPILKWWELYNPNGFDALTAVIKNPNNASIDVTYDVVYYKNGSEVARNEDFANFSILPGGESVIWANYDVPKNTTVDDVKLENIQVSKTSYEPIKGNYKYTETVDGQAYFEFEFEQKPTLANITFVLYNDKNGNKKYDKGEIVVTSTDSIMEQRGLASFDTDVFGYTDYEVYFVAY